MKESDIERKCRLWVESTYGGQVIKQTPYVGFPDRQVLLPGGISFFAEFKVPEKNLRNIQAHVKQELEKLGFTVFKVDSLDQFKAIVKEVFNGDLGA